MRELMMWGLGAFYLITGLYLMVAPMHFYMTAPGVVDTGPYNMHFIRDVGFAFTLSALGMGYGIRERLKPLVLFGASWLVTHGAFHLVLYLGHHDHMSATALIDVAIVVFPAMFTAFLAVTYQPINHKESAHA